MQLWQLHVAEQMILDDYEANPEKYKGKKLSDLSDDEGFDEQKEIEHGEAYFKKTKLPKVILVRNFYWCVGETILSQLCDYMFSCFFHRKPVSRNLT